MKSAWLLMIVLLLLVWGYSRKGSLETKRHTIVTQPGEIEAEPPVMKAATPEDPGAIATVVQPLAILKAQAKPLPTKPPQIESEEAEPQRPLPIDRPVHIEPQKPKKFLHKVFSVSNYAQFTFLVPPHQGNARLRGTFRSFTKRSDPDSTSDRTAGIDLMVLNEQQFNEFLHGWPQSVTYELDSANNQRVDWRVPTTYGEAQTYHLVFSNPAGGTKIKFVETDFTISFE